MIVFINGPFGGGKTTTAEALVELLPGARLFDPEIVGYMLAALMGDSGRSDFQDLPPWRPLVAATAAEVAACTGQDLVAPMSVLDRGYFEEIGDGLRARGMAVHHVLLRTDPATLEERIAGHTLVPGDPGRSAAGAAFRRSRAAAFFKAADGWLGTEADLVVDTTGVAPGEVARRVAEHLAGAVAT
ncbi:AAA family ATPase [Nocardiopsis protaetiae]|uniref:AAA family ATPase n=1 Tax=Nocardiopsis protaetiae TaxID=3382270 RepID=UPI00387B5A9D